MERLTVGELAKRSEVNSQTIRYYERQGLLPKPPRSESGYRAFPLESVERIRFIKQAQELGFSLNEVKELLALQDNPLSTGADVRKLAQAKVADIEAKIKTLSSMKKALTRLTATCNGNGSAGECQCLKKISLKRVK
ncbi:MAG: MerR family DNA-binding protein [Acidobacteriota bacterium]|nr:MerR family DNA-binding protein [Acidobacteriota bacterium]